MAQKSFVVGLTGGIASGKSVVSHLFEKLKVDVIDADLIAREVVAPGQAALETIVAHFGDEILEEGVLNRARLRHIIFEKCEERAWLEALLHPLIREKILQRIGQVTSPYCIVVIPLLVEKGAYPMLDRVLVIDINPERQSAFLAARDTLTPLEIERMLSSQASRSERLAKANDLIHNTADLSFLEKQVLELHGRYLAMSHSPD